MSTSAGISVYADARSADDLVAQADEALYAAKAAGRARYAWFDGDAIRTSACYGSVCRDVCPPHVPAG